MQHPLSTKNLQLVCTFIICVLAVFCSSCFIRNCPLGGKRSALASVSTIHAQRECLRCGPGGLGQCVGPNICCGTAIGCFINSAETRVCRHENDIPTPCNIDGPTCGQHQGHCVADGVCCTDENCKLEGTCSTKIDMELNNAEDDFSFSHHSDLTPDLIKYVKRLLAAKASSYRRRK